MNLACGRNPWMVASTEDASYRAFIHNPGYLRTILSISEELNYILGRIFTVDPNRRITLPELRRAILACSHFTPPEPVHPEDTLMAQVPCAAPVFQGDVDQAYDTTADDDSEDDSDSSDTSSTFSYPDSNMSSRSPSPDVEETIPDEQCHVSMGTPVTQTCPDPAILDQPGFVDQRPRLQQCPQHLAPMILGTPPMDSMTIPGQGPYGQVIHTLPLHPLPRPTMIQFQSYQMLTPPPSPPPACGQSPCGQTQTLGTNSVQCLPFRPANHISRPACHLPSVPSHGYGFQNLTNLVKTDRLFAYTPVFTFN